jgi:nucleoside-diphosphate-sugar epimerase
MHSKPHPVTTYGHSKLKAEGYLRDIEELPYLILRPTGVFGPRESDFFKLFQSINRGIAPQIGLSDQWLSLIYVRDLAHIVVKATLSEISKRAYFLTDGNLYSGTKLIDTISVSLNKNPIKLRIPLPVVYSIAALNEVWSRLSGKATILNIDKYAEIKARNLDCDISEVVADFDFIPRYTLQQAIEETAGWYKEQGWL